MLNVHRMLEFRGLEKQGKISPNAKVLLLCGQLSLDTVPRRLAEAGFLICWCCCLVTLCWHSLSIFVGIIHYL